MLGLSAELAARYVHRLRSRSEGLILDDGIDLDGLTTIIDLRERYMPEVVDGHSVYEGALDPSSGLLLPRAS